MLRITKVVQVLYNFLLIKEIEETIKIQKEIDELYPEVEKNIIKFN